MNSGIVGDNIWFSMELKYLPIDVAAILSQWLETSDLLSLISTSFPIEALFSYQPFWLLRAKRCGIYRPDFDHLESPAIKSHLVEHMKCLYRQVRTICPQRYAKTLTNLVMEDNADQLEQQVVQSAKKSATALMPIAMQFGRVSIMHSLFTHFEVVGSFQWLLHAIRHEQYSAVKYLVEVRGVPLVSDQPFALLPSVNRLWDANYSLVNESGRRHCATFNHYNDLLLREIIRCRHPKIVRYLRARINALISAGKIEGPESYLLALLNRHSVDRIGLEEDPVSPPMPLERLAAGLGLDNSPQRLG
jgi:hypothetical protein